MSLTSVFSGILPLSSGGQESSAFQEKAELLRQAVFTDWTEEEADASPAGSAGNAVFISVCDTTERASVYTGTGNSLVAAWNDAVECAENDISKRELSPVWVKVDVVNESDRISMNDLKKKILDAREEFLRYGVAFDTAFETALLEAELNGAKIYDYDNGGIDFTYLNNYLKKANRAPLDKLPEEVTLFSCDGWLCDEDKQVYPLISDGLNYGRRPVDRVDADYAKDIIMKASGFLEEQVKADGSFIYGMYPRFDNEINNYNIVRHAGTIWSLNCRYRMAPNEELEKKIELTINFMLSDKNMKHDDEGRSYLYEAKNNEIKLGGCGIAVIALTEYMDVFQNEKYKDVCIELGKGILTMLDQSDGTYYHVLNGDFSRKEEYRTIYYDGEATFALCRLYGLTGDKVWLDAAQSAVDHFIKADYTKYKDHWIAYSMNEITKYVTDRQDYFVFALENAQKNLKTIRNRDTTYHTYLELLMATFEVYDRLVQSGQSMDKYKFNLQSFLDTIYIRVDRQLNGFFFPEYAMYMRNPQRILNTFMVRHDGYRVRIDDVQHNIGGYYLYYKNYDKLVQYGMTNDIANMEDLNGGHGVNVTAIIISAVALAVVLIVILVLWLIPFKRKG